VKQIRQVLKYLYHCITARNTGGFGVHSPYVYNFIQYAIREKYSYYIFDEIEKERKILQKNKKTIRVTDFGTGNNRTRQIAEIASKSLKNKKQAQFLFRIIRYLNCRHVVELGTSLGITTLYLATGNKNISCTTFEGCPETAELARQIFQKKKAKNISLIEGNINETLDIQLKKISSPDFIFIDANHQGSSLIEYFETCLNYSTTKTIIVVDDIYWSADMEKAWKTIEENPRVTTTLDLFHLGIVFLNPDLTKKHYKIRI
jgi:predicted O-methyltransferase YrrM